MYSKKTLRCLAYCTAASYDLRRLQKHLTAQFSEATPPQTYRDVVHLSYKETGEVFFFPYGCTVCWGLQEGDEKEILELVKAFEESPVKEVDYEELTYSYSDETHVHKEHITMQARDVLSKLAVSHALAQSIKLNIFEERIQRTINKTKHIPEDLAKEGKISLSRKEISKKMGALFIERSSINLHFDILDTPEFFWENAELEPLYNTTRNALDIQTRVDVLNQRLNLVHDLFEMLGTEMNHQHSSRLEWIIIWLIAVEVVVLFVKEVFHLF